MTKKEFVNSKGETWEYEETEEMRKAVERLHQTIRELEHMLSNWLVEYNSSHLQSRMLQCS